MFCQYKMHHNILHWYGFETVFCSFIHAFNFST